VTAQKRQRLMFVILIGSVLFALVMKPWERRRPVIAVPQPDTPVADTVFAVAPPVLATVEYAAEWPSRDPFAFAEDRRAYTAATVTEDATFGPPTFALQGIMTVGGELACVVDGSTRTVGESFSGWRVEKIEAQGVWVSQGGERHYVPLP
jgi:hypothetical protein